MADKTKIEWSDATWNPITGCTLVDEGCRYCYAAHLITSWPAIGNHPSRKGLARKNAAGDSKFTGEVRFNEQWLYQPLRWKKPRRTFVCAHGDLFHESVPDEWIDRVFAVMALAPHHTFQVLTKRPDRAAQYLADMVIRIDAIQDWADEILGSNDMPFTPHWPLPNVWLGTSISDQASADLRIPPLLECLAAVRFVSAEPLLGPVDLTRVRAPEEWGPNPDGWVFDAFETGDFYTLFGDGPSLPSDGPYRDSAIDWVICGGESGPHARPMHPDWARSLRDQCVAAGVPFLFKQWGEWAEGSGFKKTAKIVLNNGRVFASTVDVQDPQDRADWTSLAPCLMRPEGKRAAGRLLDDVEWSQFPGVANA